MTAAHVGAKVDDGRAAGKEAVAAVERRGGGGMSVVNCLCCVGDVAVGSVVRSK